MMWLGLTTYPNGTTKHMTDLYPQAFQPIHCSQQNLGWKQMFYGQVFKTMDPPFASHQTGS